MPKGIAPAATAYRGVEAYAVKAPGERGMQATEVGLGAACALRGTLAQSTPRGLRGGANRRLRRAHRRSSVGGGGGNCGSGGRTLGGELLGAGGANTSNSVLKSNRPSNPAELGDVLAGSLLKLDAVVQADGDMVGAYGIIPNASGRVYCRTLRGRLGTIGTWCSVAVGAVGAALTLGSRLYQRRRRRPAADEGAGAAVPLARVESCTLAAAAAAAVTRAMTRPTGELDSVLVADVLSFGFAVNRPRRRVVSKSKEGGREGKGKATEEK
ncbi:hypothetical protein DL768_007309 [Monosporascus sp. mg162]|nr:hypothetical protein DL768_007309 [Monosporascus sp. mg162]